MKVTLTRDLAPHTKGTTLDVTPAVARRLMAKGAAEKVTAEKATASKGKTDSGSDHGEKA